MDDTPDKLRRNVVVLSAAILAIAFFNLSFKPTGTLLGFAQVGNVTGTKIWVALLVVLLYVFLRYHFCAQTTDERTTMAKDFHGWRQQAVRRCLERAVRTYFLRNRAVTWIEGFDRFVDHDIEERMRRDGPAREVDDLVVSVNWNEGHWYTGNAGFQFHAIWTSSSYGRGGGNRHDFALPQHLRAQVLANCALRAVTYSRGAVDVAVPFGLAALAFLTCTFKLAVALGSNA
ncbi:hypothetical protein [Paraburkholderia sediminicola]|uniref:hypothetical protein n=1 Tax=Paraburkholderia sediminicola TaxID=458836 RepID=UPI0038BD40ED